MDKKDQYNNPVGDDLNLSHEGQLPPIWDNISQELNAFDEVDSSIDSPAVEDTMGVDSLPNAEDYGIIKDGFQQNFMGKQPPKFMWDKIEQDLESFTVTDAPSDFSAIKAGFEQTYKESKAPKFTWEDLAEQMDNPIPKNAKTNDDYSFVKTGFEKKYSTVVVPLFSWKDLAQRMDNEAALADTPDKFSIIKESFEKEYSHRKPAVGAWSGLNQQLRMETYWGRLSHYLGSSTFARKAAIFTAIGLLIGGGKACLFDEGGTLEMPTAESIAFSEKQEEHYNKINSASFREFGNRSSTDDSDELSPANLAKEATKALLEIQEQHKQSEIKQKEKSTVVLPLVVNENGAVSRNSTDKEEINGIDENEEMPKVVTKIAATTENKVDEISSTEQEGLNDGNNLTSINNASGNVDNNTLKTNLDLFSNSSDLNWLGQDMMAVELMDSGMGLLVQKQVDDPAIEQMKKHNFSLVRQAQKGKRVRFELGPSARVGTSIFLGKNTINAFDEEQVASTQLSATGAAGVLLNYHFNLNDAIVLGTYPYSKVKQSFGDYTADGNYIRKEIELSFLDFTLGYQRTLIRYNTLGKVPSKIYARLDFGLGYLIDSKTKIDDVLVNGDAWYNKFNVSAGLTIGNTYEVNQFMIDYGVTGNVGMNNIIASSNTPILEPARLLNLGVFVGIRYIIFPRLEPSKKQRQFDWSPPFYIEEPAF